MSRIRVRKPKREKEQQHTQDSVRRRFLLYSVLVGLALTLNTFLEDARNLRLPPQVNNVIQNWIQPNGTVAKSSLPLNGPSNASELPNNPDLQNTGSLASQTTDAASAQSTGTNPVEQSCKDLSESTLAFAQDVFEHTEETSLPVWRKNNWEIPPLDSALLMSAFGNRTVVVLGDSTTAYTMDWIHKIMEGITPEELDNLQTKQLSPAMEYLDKAPVAIGGIYPKYQNAKIFWLGFRGSTMHFNCNFGNPFRNIRKSKPDILLANWGLHILANGRLKTCNVYEWVHYEDWLQRVLDLANEAGIKALLFKTSNRICRPVEDPIEQCRGIVANMSSALVENPAYMLNVSAEEKERYCNEGAFMDDASEALNSRLKAFVSKVLEERKYPNLQIAVYNDHAMQACQYSPDGVHQFAMQLPRIRLFAHMVNCMYPKS